MSAPRLSAREACELSALAAQAFELKRRESPYYLDGCAAIADWLSRWTLTRWEQHLEAEAERRKEAA